MNAPGAAPITEYGVDTADARADAGNVARPAIRTGQLTIEGTPSDVELRLVQPPAGFPLNFSTYAPPDIETEFMTEGDGASVRFNAVFPGNIDRDDAYLLVHVHPPAATGLTARNVVSGYLRSRSAELQEWRQIEAPPGVTEAYAYNYPLLPGRLAGGRVWLLRRGDRIVHVIAHYPLEMGDGFGPRMQLVIDEWEWADGSGLWGP